MTQIGSTVVVAVEEQKGSDEQRIHELSNATSNYRGCCSTGREKVKVDVIIPVHNAEKTIVETILHVCNQRFPISADECLYRTNNNLEYYHSFDLDVTICCHDDGSEDQSLALLYDLQEKIQQQQNVQSESNANPNPSATDKAVVCVRQLLISSSAVSWGAGFARNQAASLPHRHHRGEYLAMLDADDIMLKRSHSLGMSLSTGSTRFHMALYTMG